MGGRSFTEAEVQRMHQLKASGFNPTDIARKLGRSRSAVDRYVSGDPYSDGRACDDCEAKISNINTSGRCRACNRARHNRDPELKAKRVEGKRRAMSDPMKYARACRLAKANIRKAMQNPETRARFVEMGKQRAAEHYPTLRERLRDAEFRKAVGRKISAARLAWCPPEYRDAYLALVRSKTCTAAEGRQMIAAQIRADRERALSRLSPFERQERALQNGARIVANDRKPLFGEAIAV